MRSIRSRTLAVAATILVTLTGCREAPGGTVLGVTITPTEVTLHIGEMQTFTASVTVSGTGDTSVEWSASCGSITGDGHTIAYAAPATPGTCTVSATSVADPDHRATATVTVVAPSTITISVSPTAVTLPPGGTHTLAATLTGTPDPGITWTTTCGSLSATGTTATYTAPMTEGICVIVATSDADPTRRAEAVATIEAAPAGAVTLTPSAVTLQPGESQAFTATVTGHTDTTVTWTTACGAVTGTSNTVTYTAPATPTTCTLTATSHADPSESANATITVIAPTNVSVSMSPTAVTLSPGSTQSFTATVTGTTDTSVTWTTTCGAVTGSGNTITYTAPTNPGTCTLTATSNADTNQSANATITVTTPNQAVVTVTPTNATLRIGRTQTFTATVTGTTNTNVTWTTTGGTYQTTGNSATYSAPNVLGDYTLTATSTADPIRHASATIRVVAHPDEIWARQFGSDTYDVADGVAVDADGNVYVAGQTYGDLFGAAIADYDAFIVKFDVDGQTLWSRKAGSDRYTFWSAVAVGPAGHVVVVGSTEGSVAGTGANAGGEDVIVAKYAPDGTRQWLVQHGSTGHDTGLGIAVDGDGNVFVAGGTWPLSQSHTDNWDATVMKFDAHGAHQWTHQFGTTADDVAHGVAVGSAGNVVATGATGGNLTGAPNQGSDDAFVVKLDTNGSVTWLRQFGSDGRDIGRGVAIDHFGDVIVVGETEGSLPGLGLSHGGTDAFVAKLTADGAPRWADQYGTSGDDTFHAVAVGPAGNVVAAGSTTGAYAEPNPAGVQHGLVVKLDNERRQVWARQLSAWPASTTWTHYTGLNDVAIGPAGNVLVVGFTDGDLAGPNQGFGYDAFVAKFVP